MNAQQLTARLKGKWYESKLFGLAPCPAHDDSSPSLSIGIGDDGRTLLNCFAGCSHASVVSALRALRLWDGVEIPTPPSEAERERLAQQREREEARRRESALALWHDTRPATGTLAEAYIRSRAITLPVPASIRYLPGAKHGRTGLLFPCMVAAIARLDRRITAVHRTFINAYGTGKAGVSDPKLALGHIGRGAVRLAPAGAELGLAEGIETGLSAQQLFGIPVWAACGSWLEKVAIPDAVSKVVIFADNGPAGEQAAEKAARVHIGAGRVVDVRFPAVGEDWNDALQARRATGRAA